MFSALVGGCSTEGKQATLPYAAASLTVNPAPALEQKTPENLVKAQPSSQADPYPDATSKAIGAATISQSAQSPDDWKLVTQMWQEAIALIQSVPNTSSNYASAQKNVAEYQKNLAYANKQSVKPIAPVVATAEPVIQQASFSSVSSFSNSSNSAAAKPRPLTTITPAQSHMSKPKQLTFEDKERVLEASAKAFMDDYFDQVVNKGYDGTPSWCAKTYELASSPYSPESAKILHTWVASDGSMASVRSRIESSNGGGSPIRYNWEFYLRKGDTYLEKQMLKDDSKESYKYSKSKYGGWCIETLMKS